MTTLARPIFETEQPDRWTGQSRSHSIDRWIFVFTAASFVAIILIGFIPDSFSKIAAIKSGARPPFPPLMHVHSVLMGSFMMLLLGQTWLAATGRIRWHMQMGILSAVLVPALVVVGMLLAQIIYRESVVLAQTATPDAKAALDAIVARKENILLNQIRIMTLFPLFVLMALAARKTDAGFHKRMMILATAIALPPAINRMTWLPSTFPVNNISTELYALLAVTPMFVWDVVRNKMVHKAYLIWAAITLPVALLVGWLWNTPYWHASARQILLP
jgi:hypothetical protein